MSWQSAPTDLRAAKSIFRPRQEGGPWAYGPMRELFKLESSAGTGYFYVFSKNKKKQQGKLEVKKYDPRARQHVLFVEKKLSK